MKLASPWLAVVTVLTTMTAAIQADDPKAQTKVANQLVGSWKCTSAKYNGRDANPPMEVNHVKHVTPTQFIWATYDSNGTVEAMLGGSYSLKGNEYVETPEYGTVDVLTQLKGKPQAFTWKIEGTKWYHTGKLSSGTTIEEVWERIEKK
jgi:hypothetical protein